MKTITAIGTLILFVFFNQTAIGQNNVSAEQLMQMADEFRARSDIASALTNYEKAALLFEKDGPREKAIDA
jgi:hypothetical protein